MKQHLKQIGPLRLRTKRNNNETFNERRLHPLPADAGMESFQKEDCIPAAHYLTGYRFTFFNQSMKINASPI
jgi:hypothetical protein